ncbi:MAG: hypothetical protein U0521_08720 [Anaerolineae bacterium]
MCLSLAALALAACASQQAGDPADAVEAYLKAMVANETDKLASLVCPAYESGRAPTSTRLARLAASRSTAPIARPSPLKATARPSPARARSTSLTTAKPTARI